MKPLASCANGDGRPIKAPSKVLCAECLDALGKKIEALADAYKVRAAGHEVEDDKEKA